MSTSRDDERLLDTLFEEAREAPLPEDLRRVEDGLQDWLASDRKPEPPTALQGRRSLSGRALKVAGVAVAVAALVSVGVLSQTFRDRSAHRDDASPATTVTVAPLEPSAPVPVPETSVAVADLPSIPDTPQSPTQAPARSTPPRARVAQVAPPPGAATERGPSEASEMAESEASFLRRTRAALVADPAQALRMTEEHASRYPRGVLLQERDVIAIDALVRLGRRDEARARATAFHARYPSSAHASHLAAIVEAEPK
jgi:hypothetical protein